MVTGRHIGQYAQPAEGIGFFVSRPRGVGYRLTADPMIAVAAGDIITVQPEGLPVLVVSHVGRSAVDIMQGHVLDLEDQRRTAPVAGVDQILGHLRLPIDRDLRSSGQALQIDPKQLAVQRQVEAVVRQAFGLQALIDTHAGQEINGRAFQDAGAYAALHIGPVALFQDDARDPVNVQKLRQQQTGGARANDGDLGAHDTLMRSG